MLWFFFLSLHFVNRTESCGYQKIIFQQKLSFKTSEKISNSKHIAWFRCFKRLVGAVLYFLMATTFHFLITWISGRNSGVFLCLTLPILISVALSWDVNAERKKACRKTGTTHFHIMSLFQDTEILREGNGPCVFFPSGEVTFRNV